MLNSGSVVSKSKFEEAPREVVKLRTKQRRTDHGSLATKDTKAREHEVWSTKYRSSSLRYIT